MRLGRKVLSLLWTHTICHPWEQWEPKVLKIKGDSPAVSNRIRVLISRMAQANRWKLLVLRFSRQFRQNLAELEALIQYAHSRAVWEIAYLSRKQVAQKLSLREARELDFLTLFHDCPEVLNLTRLRLKAEFGELSSAEARELQFLQRNPFRHEGVPSHVLEMLWPDAPLENIDWRSLESA